MKYSSLLAQLLPVLAPREVAARDAKEAAETRTGLPPERVGAFYITPCAARMVAIQEHPGMERSFLDGAVAIRDLFQSLVSALARGTPGEGEAAETASGVSWAYAGAIPGSLPMENVLAVAGLPNVIRILDAIEKGRLQRYTFVECRACPEGCVGGTLTVANPYVARTRIIEWARSLPPGPAVDLTEVEMRYKAGVFTRPAPFAARPPRPVDEDMTRAIVKMKERDRILAGLPGINIVAVAHLKGLAGVVLVNGRLPEDDCAKRADEEGIPIVSTPWPAFEVAGVLCSLGLRGRRPWKC